MFSLSSDPAKMIDNKVDQSFSALLSRLSFLQADLIILTLSQVPSGTLQSATPDFGGGCTGVAVR